MTSSFIDSLELSVRAVNRLSADGIETREQFMALSKQRVMAWKFAGTKTWREIRDVQESLARNTWRSTLPGEASTHLQALNRLAPSLEANGFFIHCDPKGRLRLGRYVNRDDYDEFG